MNIKTYASINPDSLIGRAYTAGKKAHAGQKRKSGTPYFEHCIATAQFIADLKLDEQTIVAALLHDSAEDTGYSIDLIRNDFGDEIAFLVDGVTKLGRLKYRGIEEQVENMRKMILALSQDIRVVIIKLADRLHNMRTLQALPPQKQKRIAIETTDIYAPLAYRLGMQMLSGELEDLAFPYIYPREYRWLKDHLSIHFEEHERYLERVKPLIQKELHAHHIEPILIDSRAKRYSSLYKKLLRYDMDIEKIYDLVALRIILVTVEECYATLGIIHKHWPPLPGRIKDYIALPKPNGYRSLHTTVFCEDKRIAEIQIRTKEMHEEAESGIAAHWAYEETKGTKAYLENKASHANTHEIAWVQQLRTWQQEHGSPDGFIQSLKIDFFKDRIFAITPKGEVVDLPVGATPVDFAYQIHSEIGDTCVGARVNGKIVALDYILHSGNIVEILNQKGKLPSESWLEFAKTTNARHHIRASIRSGTQKGAGLLKSSRTPTRTEFRITLHDQVGALKEIVSVITRSHINIHAVNTPQREMQGKFLSLRIQCDLIEQQKIEKLVLKLKTIKSVREISFRLLA